MINYRKMEQRRRTIMVHDKDWKQLEQIAKKQKTSVSAIVRQAISNRIEKDSK